MSLHHHHHHHLDVKRIIAVQRQLPLIIIRTIIHLFKTPFSLLTVAAAATTTKTTTMCARIPHQTQRHRVSSQKLVLINPPFNRKRDNNSSSSSSQNSIMRMNKFIHYHYQPVNHFQYGIYYYVKIKFM